jgi:adenylosuccinate lyase
MCYLFSPHHRICTWRKLWYALLRSQQELGLEQISEEQVYALAGYLKIKVPVDSIYAEFELEKTLEVNFELALEYEKRFRHDVMAHIHCLGDACPEVKSVLHLGATSCYVTDNGDIIIIREALQMLRTKLVGVIDQLRQFADKCKDVPTLGLTHFQAAQLTTVGKRATLWMQDLVTDLENFEFVIGKMKFRGVKGTTGTQASYLSLFNGDAEKVKGLDQMVTDYFGFDKKFDVCGQTYSRKQDVDIVNALMSFATSVHKMCTDIRLLAGMKEMNEPFESEQIGSSAMAYKRNPMRSERACAIARHLITLAMNTAHTQAVQWFERSLDDSANRRITLPEAFLCADALLSILLNIISGLVIYPKVIAANIEKELPFMATEDILMRLSEHGVSRQEAHEKIRVLSLKAAENVNNGKENNLIELMRVDPFFNKLDNWDEILEPSRFIGRCEEQVDDYSEYVNGILCVSYEQDLKMAREMNTSSTAV